MLWPIWGNFLPINMVFITTCEQLKYNTFSHYWLGGSTDMRTTQNATHHFILFCKEWQIAFIFQFNFSSTWRTWKGMNMTLNLVYPDNKFHTNPWRRSVQISNWSWIFTYVQWSYQLLLALFVFQDGTPVVQVLTCFHGDRIPKHVQNHPLSTALLPSGIKPRGVYKIDYKCSQTRVTINSFIPAKFTCPMVKRG